MFTGGCRCYSDRFLVERRAPKKGSVQVDELDILTGCQGWSLESGPTKPQALELCLRYGPLFRLRLFFDKSEDGPPAAQGFLDLTSSGRLVQVTRS